MLFKSPQKSLWVSTYQINDVMLMFCVNSICIPYVINKKYVAYSSQGSHTGQLDFCKWLAEAVRRDNVINITLHQV